jgi:hypothetical protein
MFVILFFVFFGSKQFVSEDKLIRLDDNIKKISIASNTSDIVIKNSTDQTATIKYQVRKLNNNEGDQVFIQQHDGEITLSVQRQRSNPLSNIRLNSGQIEILVPHEYASQIVLNVNIGNIKISDVSFEALSLDSKACNVNIDKCSINNFFIRSIVTNVSTKNSVFENFYAQSNIGNFLFGDIKKLEGFNLDSNVNIGMIKPNVSLDFKKSNIVVDYEDNIFYGTEKLNFKIDSNVANIVFS